MGGFVGEVLEKVLGGGKVTRGEAERLARDEVLIDALMGGAAVIREKHFGRMVGLCSVVNARSGVCSEDCSFCAQSARWKTGVERFGWIGEERVAVAARRAGESGASMLGIVTSGRSVDGDDEFEEILDAVERVAGDGSVDACASLGMLHEDQAGRLKERGLRRYHHNLETSRGFFPGVCSTHVYDDMVDTVRAVKAAGLEVCCGGIFGLGESWTDRVDLALTLRDLGVDSVPLNFLIPIPGTPLASRPLLSPEEALRIIALFRFILPDVEIRVCGGREACLGDLQARIFHAGASGTMTGDYLTRAGRRPSEDLEMIKALGLEVAR
ncbi:MAG: biotin synthase BioB [Candidatus Tritonobacter lacicola]|nr:biotin synthase BioB [Candidatus Tritonobacter lacicola]